MDELIAVRDEIVAITATTLDGLRFKARMALPYEASEKDELKYADCDEDLVISIVNDLLAMG